MTLSEALEILIQHQKWRQGLTNDMPYTPSQLTEALDILITELQHQKPDISGALLLAGKLATTARLVTTANSRTLSQRIEQMEAALDAYDKAILSLPNSRN